MVAMRFPLIVFLSLLGLGVSRVSNQESAALAKNVYDPSSPLPEHMQDQWRAVETLHDRQVDFFALVFKKAPTNETVVAVRGTNSLQNFVNDNLQIVLGEMPRMAKKLIAELRRLSMEHPSLYLTGHSLGAAVVKTAFASLALSDDVWLERIAGVVLFENPGIQEELVDRLKNKLQAKFIKFREKITEFFGAPNPINMVASHVAGTQVRVLIDHGQQVDFKHGLTCAANSLGRAAFWVTAVRNAAKYAKKLLSDDDDSTPRNDNHTNQTASNASSSDEVSDWLNLSALGFTIANVLSVGTFCALVGLESSRFTAWVLGQHSMTAIHEAFGRREDMPPSDKHIRMESWPSGASVQSAFKLIPTNAIPFHPANHGIHSCHNPDGVLEERISLIEGYVPMSTSPALKPRVKTKGRWVR